MNTGTFSGSKGISHGALPHETPNKLRLLIVLVVIIEFIMYATNPASPMQHPPAGDWNLWWDQSLYLNSATALANWDFSASQHWYPPGYAILGAPFVWLLPKDPFLFVNLISIAIFAWAFMQFFRPIIGFWWSAASLLLSLLFPLQLNYPLEISFFIWRQFSLPWNTIPVAAALMTILLLLREVSASSRTRYDILLGVCAALVVVIRPSDVIALLPFGAVYAYKRLIFARSFGKFLAAVLGALAIILPFTVLMLVIYGGFQSQYLDGSQAIGFSVANIGDRAVWALIDAWSAFHEPALLDLQPWLAFAVPLAIAWALLKPRTSLLPLLVIVASVSSYLAYNDFWPYNMVRYQLIHYFCWSLPLITAGGVAGARALIIKKSYLLLAIFGLAIPTAISSYRIEAMPVPATSVSITKNESSDNFIYKISFPNAEQVNAIDFMNAKLSENEKLIELTFRKLDVEIEGTSIPPFGGYRTLVFPDRIRLIFNQHVRARNIKITLDESMDNKPSTEDAVVPLYFSSRWEAPFSRIFEETHY